MIARNITVSDCNIDLHRNEDGSRVDIADNTSLLFYGDVGVSVNFTNGFSGDKDAVVGQVASKIKESLSTFRCANIDTHVEDRRRNIYIYTVVISPLVSFRLILIETKKTRLIYYLVNTSWV